MDELEFEVQVKCEDTEDPKAETRGRISIDDKSYQDISLIGATEQTLKFKIQVEDCLLYTSPSPRDLSTSRMPSSA